MQTRQRVVIVGGGFAGLEAAKALAGHGFDITIIDRENHHCFQPLLYQVATAALSPAEIAWPIRSIFRSARDVTVLMADVTGVDPEGRYVAAGARRIPYDKLILATGAGHSYFGHDEWAKHAPGLKRIEDATTIRRNILLGFERAELTEDAKERDALLTYTIIGGGPTGVEMAGAISEIARKTLARDFRRVDPKTSRILLIEAGPRLLPAFPENLSAYTQRALERMGVTVLTNTRVTGIDASGVDTSTGRIESATRIWAAGVGASPAASWIGSEADRAGRAAVTPWLKAPVHDHVFIIGDTAAMKDARGQPVPGIAPAAKQMGRFVANVIKAERDGRAVEPFVYKHSGDLATIGRKAAVVKLGRFELTGFIGWLVWSLAHVYFLIGLRNRLLVALSWLLTYATFQRGARLVTREPRVDGTAIDRQAGSPGEARLPARSNSQPPSSMEAPQARNPMSQ
ncbi:MAG: dehydrogenase protein [Hyphomicrobiales bacterium]|nr:dehydrogenase protein [Hyphomicrobiales bacterium]